MLGFIGFTITACIIGFFAISFYASFKELGQYRRRAFSSAFLLLGLAFLVWGFAPLINNPGVTTALVFGGDILLVAGTALLIAGQFRSAQLWLIVTLALAATAILVARAYAFEPAAVVRDGLLHFSLEGAPRYVIIAMLAFVWMPLGARITQLAVRARGAAQFSSGVALVYVVALICAAIFIGARQNAIIIASFAALAFTFLILAFIPPLIDKYARTLVEQPRTLGKEIQKK